MDVRDPRITVQFARKIESIYSNTDMPNTIVSDLFTAVNTEEETRRRGDFSFSAELFNQQETLIQQIKLEESRFYRANRAYKIMENNLQNTIDEINIEIDQLREQALTQNIIKMGKESELELEKIDGEENLKSDIEAESCFRKYIFCCCTPAKIKTDEAKVALLDQKMDEAKNKMPTHPLITQIKQLCAKRKIALNDKKNLKAPKPIHDQLKLKLNKIETEIALRRAKFFGAIHLDTMYRVICAYDYCFSHQSEIPEIASAFQDLTNIFQKFYCVDMKNRSANGIFNEYRQLTDKDKLAMFQRKELPAHLVTSSIVPAETKATLKPLVGKTQN